MQEDRAILLSCFGIALIFWVLVKLSQEYTSQKAVSFRYETSEGLALVSIPPTDVFVMLRGTGWNLMLEHLASSAISALLTIEEVGDFNLNRSQLRALIQEALRSKELTIVEVNYERISLKVEEELDKKVPVHLRLKLGFADEHHLSSPPELHPDSIRLTGATSVVQSIEHWATDSMTFQGLTNTVTVTVPMEAPPPEILLDTTAIAVTIPVEAYTEKSLFVPVKLRNTPSDSLKVFPDKIRVSFVVGLSQYDSVHYTDFSLVADLKAASLEKGKNTAPVNLEEAPKAVKNIVLSRESVEFFIVQPEERDKEQLQ